MEISDYSIRNLAPTFYQIDEKILNKAISIGH